MMRIWFRHEAELVPPRKTLRSYPPCQRKNVGQQLLVPLPRNQLNGTHLRIVERRPACLPIAPVIHSRQMSNPLTVRIPEELSSWLAHEAARTGLSQGKIVRDQLEKAKAASGNKTFMRLAGTVKGPRNLSRRKGFASS